MMMNVRKKSETSASEPASRMETFAFAWKYATTTNVKIVLDCVFALLFFAPLFLLLQPTPLCQGSARGRGNASNRVCVKDGGEAKESVWVWESSSARLFIDVTLCCCYCCCDADIVFGYLGLCVGECVSVCMCVSECKRGSMLSDLHFQFLLQPLMVS